MKAVSIKELISKMVSVLKVVQTGSVTITNVSTTEQSVSVTFPKAYNTAPTVVACLATTSYNRRVHVSSVTRTGFTAVVALTSGTGTASCWVNWISVGGGYCVTSVFSRLSAVLRHCGKVVA